MNEEIEKVYKEMYTAMIEKDEEMLMKLHDDISVTVNGNTAAVTGKSNVEEAVFGGGRHTWHLQLDMRLANKNGSWIFTEARASTY